MRLRTLTITAVAALALAAPAAQGAVLDPAQSFDTPVDTRLVTAGSWIGLVDTRTGIPVAAGIWSEMPEGVTAPVAGPESIPFSWGDAGLGAAAAILLLAAFVGSVRLSNLTRDAQQSLRTS